MELRHIRYFLAVVEEGSFTRAAARLGIGQPPLSLQIKDLETEVGARLLDRLSRGVELTAAGRAFLGVVRSLPERALEAVQAARRAARGETGELKLGFTGTAVLNPVVPSSIRAFRHAFPDVELRLEEANSLVLVEGLLSERLDVAILRPTAADPQELRVEKIIDEELVAALPAAHAAARGKGRLDLRQLQGDPFIMTPRALGIGLHEAILQACRDAGFEPTRGQPAPQIASILSLVSAELGVTLVPASMRQLGGHGVAYRELQVPSAKVSLGVAYRSTRSPQLAANFAAVVRTVIAPARPGVKDE